MNFDQSARTLSADRPAFHRVLRAVELNTDKTYMEAYDMFAKGMALADGGTVAATLWAVGVHSLDSVGHDVRTLELADEARDKIHAKIAGTMQLDAVGSQDTIDGPQVSRNQADTGPRIDAKTYARVMAGDPTDHERHFEAQRLPGGGRYQGPEGVVTHGREDKASAASGLDLNGTLRRDASVRSARTQANRATQRLEQAINNGTSPRERRRMLESAASSALKQLDGEPVRPLRQGPLVQLDSTRPLSTDAREILNRVLERRPRDHQQARSWLMEDTDAREANIAAHTEAFLRLLEEDV